MRIKINGSYKPSDSIFAAGEDDENDGLGSFDDMGPDDEASFEDDESFDDTLDGIADDIEDLQDDIDEVEEDEISIDTDNNIDGHYIAECDRCHGIFISAVTQSDQTVESIKGVCPLCDKESEQFLKWVIQAVDVN